MASTWMMSSMANLMHDGLGDLISFGPPPGAGPLILSEEADPTSRLSLGVPITERFSITYSMALDDTERRMWILDYRLAHNIWLRGIQENANDYSVGLSQRFDIDVREALSGRRRHAGQAKASPLSTSWGAILCLCGAPKSEAGIDTTIGKPGTRPKEFRHRSSRTATSEPW